MNIEVDNFQIELKCNFLTFHKLKIAKNKWLFLNKFIWQYMIMNIKYQDIVVASSQTNLSAS